MRTLLLISACLILAAPATALAQDNSAAPAPAKPVKEKKYCRQGMDTGSIMPHSTCHTKAEWDQIDQANQENAQAYSNARRNAGGH